ncbi:MAG: DUF4920 domain-containing protein [Myxococcota bacterium]
MKSSQMAIAMALCLTACQRNGGPETTAAAAPKGTSAETRDQIDPDGVVRRGRPLSESPAIELASATAHADELAGRIVKVKGTVDSVCSAAGCWMVLRGENAEPVRITAEGYGFFVPRKSPGLRAVVEGVLTVEEVSPRTLQHYEDDRVAGTDEEPRQIESARREISIVAHGLELRRPT